MELFDLPRQRLDPATHDAVFGDLPAVLAADLHTPEVGDLVLQLLDRGWRQGQVATRVGAMPAGPDPEADVVRLLTGLLAQQPPDVRWREQRAEREAARSSAQFEQPASEDSRRRWIAQIRQDLSGPRTPRPEPLVRMRPACALCAAESEFFVTRQVRLCGACVELLGTGAVTLPEAG
ncbi:MAG: hypothetical protein JWN87_2486 [Frankiales bacterium]|jgi:hypothetical protein|nr:hypothetical protein [Frankiales bacterium]MCW2586226.1 hypothetical protein [Frankiales bacterium]